MVEREKLAVLASPVSDTTVGTGLRYEEVKYSGLIDLVLSRSVLRFSFVTLSDLEIGGTKQNVGLFIPVDNVRMWQLSEF
jgi:hypothetical protein